MSFTKIIGTLFGGENGVIGQVKDLADTFITTKQEKAEFQAKLEQIAHRNETELINAHNSEIANARDMQKAALSQDDKFSKRFVYYLATFWSLLAGAFVIIILFKDIPEANTRLVDTILGFLLGTIIASVINYFFGSSSGSAMKNDLIGKK